MQRIGFMLLALLLVLWAGPGILRIKDPGFIPGEQITAGVQQIGTEVSTSTESETKVPGLDVEAKGSVLMEPLTGEILWHKNAHERYYPASMTKLMTMVVTMDMVANEQASLEEEVITSERAESFGGSEVFLATGEIFSLEEMLIAVAVASANDASVAIAEHLAGSEEAFVELMNAKANELGLKNTNFSNCHGLHDEQNYTSAYDMALLARYALRYPKIREWASIKQYTFREEPLSILDNTNKMLYWYPGTDGFKTGFTDAAGLNLVSTVERDDLRFIVVVMGVEIPRGNFTESMKLYNWVFKQWAFKKLYSPGEIVCSVPVGKGQIEHLDLIAKDKIGAVVNRLEDKDKEITARANLPIVINAPIKKGETVGEAAIFKDDKEIGQVDLIAGEDVARASLGQELVRTIKAIFTIRQ